MKPLTVAELKIIREAGSLEELTQKTIQLARQKIGADGVTFVLRENDSCYYLDEEAIGPLWKGGKFPLGSCVSGWVINFKEVCVIEDIAQDDRVPFDVYRPTFVKSLCMVPIGTRTPIGAIGAYWKNLHVATKEQVAYLRVIADATYVALKQLLQVKPDPKNKIDPIEIELRNLHGIPLIVATKKANASQSTRLASYLAAHGASVFEVQIELEPENNAYPFDLQDVQTIVWNHQHESNVCSWQKDIGFIRQKVGKDVKFIHVMDGSCNYCAESADGDCIEDALIERYLLSDLAIRISSLVRS